MRRNPFEELEELFDRMEAQFESGVGFGPGSVAVDVLDAGDEYVVTADLPGFEADTIDLTYSDGRLHLSADYDADGEPEGDGRYLRRERRHSSVDRTVRLPDPVLEEEIGATYDEGVLTVTLPKEEDEDEEGQRIEIE